jgi:site-specific DNA recombinase
MATATSARPARRRHTTRLMAPKPKSCGWSTISIRRPGLSIGAIARLLRGMGVPSRRRVRWERSVVWAILRNPAYKGTACFNPSLWQRSGWLTTGASHPAGPSSPASSKGLVSCRKCGYALSRTSARTSARKIHYYRCLGSDLGGPVCDSRPIRQDLLDQIVWQEVIHLIEDPPLIQAELDRRLDAAGAAEPTKRRQEALERELTRIKKSM